MSPAKKITPAHPATGGEFAEHEGVKMLGLVNQSQDTSALLVRIRHIDPSDQSFVKERPRICDQCGSVGGERLHPS